MIKYKILRESYKSNSARHQLIFSLYPIAYTHHYRQIPHCMKYLALSPTKMRVRHNHRLPIFLSHKFSRCIFLLQTQNSFQPKIWDCFTLCLYRFLHPSSKHGRYTSTTKWRTLEPDYREQFVFNNTSPTDLTKQTLNITVWHQEKGKPDIYMGKSEHLNNTSPL